MLPSNVETPATLNWFANNVVFWVVIPMNVDNPATSRWFAKSLLVWVVMPGPNVETPVTFKSSSSVWPSTSKSLFASIFALNVASSSTVNLSKVVSPSTSKWLPTYNFLATAAPPSMVTEPPSVESEASSVLSKLDLPVTSKVFLSLVELVTSNVPCISVFPLSVSTVNLSTFPFVCILKNLLSALIMTLSWKVASPSTFKVLFNSVCSSTVNVLSNWTARVACKVPVISKVVLGLLFWIPTFVIL